MALHSHFPGATAKFLLSYRQASTALLAAGCVSLVACGGGGGGPTSSSAARVAAVAGTPAVLDTAAKAQAVAANGTAQASNVDKTTSAGTSSAASGVVSAAEAAPAKSWVEFLTAVQQQAMANTTLAGLTKTGSCSGGGQMTVTVTGNQTTIFAAGNTVTVDLASCVLASGSNQTSTGKITYVMLKGALGADNSEAAILMEPLKTQQGTTSTTYDGAMKLSIKSFNSVNISAYNGAALTTEFVGSTTYKETVSSFDWTYGLNSFGILSVYGGATVDSNNPKVVTALGESSKYSWAVAQSNPLLVNTSSLVRSATSGRMKVTGAKNTSVQITMGQTCTVGGTANCVSVEYDSDGDSAYEKQETLTWSDFAAKF